MVLREAILFLLQPSRAGSVGFAWPGWLLPRAKELGWLHVRQELNGNSVGAALCRALQVGELETKRDAPHCANAHAEDAPSPLSDAGDGPCGAGTQGRELAARRHRTLGRGLLASAALGEPEAVGAGGGPGTASLPGPCHLSAGVCSGRRAEGALWAGAGGQTVNMAKQAGLSAALLAAGREKITPGKQCGCGAGGAGCHSGTQPARDPGYFSTRSRGGSRAGDGDQRGGRVPAFVTCSPRQVGGAAGRHSREQVAAVGFLGERPLERALWVPPERGAWGQQCQPTGSPSTAAEMLASKAEGISGDGDRVCPAALGALPPLAPGFASSWAGICFWSVAPFARAGVCLCRTVPSCLVPLL